MACGGTAEMNPGEFEREEEFERDEAESGEDEASSRLERVYRGEAGGWLSRALWPFTSYLLANLAVPFILLIWFVLNRTRVYGRHRVPRETNTLLLANHQSMIDSFLLTFTAFFPHELVRPALLPWHAAAAENFFRNRFAAWLFTQLKCIPVRPGRRDLKTIHRSVRALRHGTMILFPEGTRSRDGTIGAGRPGAGLAILGTRPHVIPVTLVGMDDVLPVGALFPRIGKRVAVYFGKPLDYSDLIAGPRSREMAQAIVDRVMERIRFQRRVVERLERRRR